MKALNGALRDLWRKDDGAALVEYAILIALIAVVAVIFISSLGKKISNKFSELDSKL
jgi:pilus assembly protein Flp/PilA